MKKAYLYQKFQEERSRCNTCLQRCFIEPNQRGVCGTRENINGKLYSLVYGKAIAEHIDPIEKKPFFHFMPGSFSLSVATVGCCFSCFWCQNWNISQKPKICRSIEGFDLPPEQIIKDTKNQKCPSISYTYTEPSIFLEYALDTMKLAKKEGLKNIWVSNGYMTPESLNLIAPYLDAINVDLKAFKNTTYQKYIGGQLQPVLNNLKEIYRRGIHLEITTLVIPGVNDSEGELLKMAQFIKNELGPEVPWHISRFFPAYKMLNTPETPLPVLDRAYEMGKKAGLKFVYLGNVLNPNKESTFCPKCGELIILRSGYEVKIKKLKIKDKKGYCGKCKEDLNIKC